MTMRPAAWTPTSTYRLQLGPDLTFAQVRAVVPYLARLGVEAIYLSPMLKARPGSTHGYDIVDHASVNPELGTEEDLRQLAADAQARGLRLMADIVPNHMGVDPRANQWWREVLENGPCSSYAEYFDIDWEPITPHLHQKVLLPILGDQYGVVLERGELQVEYEDGRLQLRYYDHVLPINPRQTPLVLRLVVPALRETLGDTHPAVIEFLSILEGLQNLPPYTDTDPERIAVREREKEVLRGRLLRLTDDTPLVVSAIGDAVREVNGQAGHPRSFDALHALLEAQPYRLASWRTAVDEINYRRFFDVNELAGVRVEHDAVFEATHTLVGRWLADGLVHALRLDHPDGLYDPPAYFGRLQQLVRDTAPQLAPLYVVAEKILSGDEQLPSDWEVHGTTGYQFLNEVNGIFLDPDGLRNVRRLYGRLTGMRAPLDEVVYDAKQLIMNTTMSSELGVLSDALARIARADRRTRDFTLDSLRELIMEYVACLPVYRTYVSGRGWTSEDARVIDQTIAAAARRNPAMERSLFGFLRSVLLPDWRDAGSPEPGEPSMYERRLAFTMKLQQYTGPVQAKGVEDTAFYRYNVLVSTTEVGGEPARAPQAVAQFHAANRHRQGAWPGEMTALSTHDTKLGEDVRARVNAITELADEWRHTVGRVVRVAAGARTPRQGGWAPDRNDEYRFLQVLMGCWPAGVPMQSPAPAGLADRLKAYMLKAIREAKRHTSWIAQDEAYEAGVVRYVDAVLHGPAAPRVLATLRPMAERLARAGVCNGLAQTVLKLTAPGVPDTYQGTEVWKLDLVDPDNRRPVPFDDLDGLLDAVDTARAGADGPPLAEWLEHWPDGRIKLHVASTLLRARRSDPSLWLDGEYVPLEVETTVDATAVAFARRTDAGAAAVVLAGVRTARLPGAWPIGSVWATSRVLLPGDLPGGPWRDLISGAVINPTETASERWFFLAQAWQQLPVAVLVPLPPD